MDLQISLFILLVMMVKYIYSDCSVSRSNLNCTYTLFCVAGIDADNVWNELTGLEDYYDDFDNSCGEQFVLTIIFDNLNKIPVAPVPQIEIDVNNNGRKILASIYNLDISSYDYKTIPVFNSMPKLTKLNLTRNHVTTAILSNMYELGTLSEIDLSYNKIDDIRILNYQYPYKNLIKINLAHNALVKVPDPIFLDFNYINEIDLSYNHIETLTTSTFDRISSIKNLSLANNRLKSFNPSRLRFSELKFLNLSNNMIEVITSNDFKQLIKLEILDLSSNIIRIINHNAFISTSYLQEIYLNNNMLEVLQENIFANLQLLFSVDVSNNKMRSLPVGLFHKNNSIANVTTFSIAKNRLEGALLTGMFENINIQSLDLSNQSLTEIKDYAFYGLTVHEKLNIRSNNISLLSNMCFKNLVNLQELDLSHNRIMNIDFDKSDLNNLRILLLKNNHLTEIKFKQLELLNNLEFLDLSENRIAQIQPNSFQSLKKLNNLDIKSNPLVEILPANTFNGLVSLPTLDILHTMLTTIQNYSFYNMNELKTLNLSYNEIRELQYNAFLNVTNIETLDLSHNKLQDFFINGTILSNLFSLFLNNNLIKTLSVATLDGFSRLSNINLSYNEKLILKSTVMQKDLDTVVLSGIDRIQLLSNMSKAISISNLIMTNSSLQNVSQVHVSKKECIISLELSHNNISKLYPGDFFNMRNLQFLSLSFNKIYFIEPGVFKDNENLAVLNVSHNRISFIGYGLFHGLNQLKTLDMSYNNIKDIERGHFYELNFLEELIIDYNNIDSINIEEFEGTKIKTLSAGNNPLPCQSLIKLMDHFHVTAIEIVAHSHENVNGVTCNKARNNRLDINNTFNMSEPTNVLDNITNTYINSEKNEMKYLKNITEAVGKLNSFYEDKLSKIIEMTSDTNILFRKVIKSIDSKLNLNLICVALILLIFVGLLVHKMCKSEIFKRNTNSRSTYRLTRTMSSSNL